MLFDTKCLQIYKLNWLLHKTITSLTNDCKPSAQTYFLKTSWCILRVSDTFSKRVREVKLQLQEINKRENDETSLNRHKSLSILS